MAWRACHSDPGCVVQGTQCSVVTQRGKKSKKEGIYIYISDSLCCVVETNTAL